MDEREQFASVISLASLHSTAGARPVIINRTNLIYCRNVEGLCPTCTRAHTHIHTHARTLSHFNLLKADIIECLLQSALIN